MITVSTHPLIGHKMTQLRNKKTDSETFRKLTEEISRLLVYEATRDLLMEEVRIETPLMEHTGTKIGERVILVPILRAGLGMVHAFAEMIPYAEIGLLGMVRDEKTLMPSTYYEKLPPEPEKARVILLDPMLATGHTAADAIEHIKKKGCQKIRLVSLIAAPEGIRVVETAHPDVSVIVAQVDEKLNEHGYILPGLGDAGDRLFSTL